jgi:hypothetical protein
MLGVALGDAVTGGRFRPGRSGSGSAGLSPNPEGSQPFRLLTHADLVELVLGRVENDQTVFYWAWPSERRDGRVRNNRAVGFGRTSRVSTSCLQLTGSHGVGRVTA